MNNRLDIGAAIYSQYERTLKLAKEAEKKNVIEDAVAQYRKAAELMRQYSECSSYPDIRSQRADTAVKLETLAKEILSGNYQRKEKLKLPNLKPDENKRNDPATPADEDDFESELTGLITKTSVTWGDIGGLENTKQQIQSAYVMALAKKPIGQDYNTLNRILFFGPPGTGKTTLAAAVAGTLKTTFFQVNSHNLISKYVGDSSKQIAALYSLARKRAPSVIFIDEIDAMVPPPGAGENSATRMVVNSFKNTLDGRGRYIDKEFVLTIAATNNPRLLDEAILSRFRGNTIYIPLPDAEARKAIFNIHLTRKGQKTAVSIDHLVSSTSNLYSGREIEMVCQQAIRSMLVRANPGMEDLADKDIEYIRNYQLVAKELNQEDFDSAFKNVKPVATPGMLLDYETWMQNFNTKGSVTGG